jgi:hypothetical protein
MALTEFKFLANVPCGLPSLTKKKFDNLTTIYVTDYSNLFQLNNLAVHATSVKVLSPESR